ncbi:MAG: non-heme iron oxygenase ferredoxin subunit [Verrucomicrobiota bacterium]
MNEQQQGEWFTLGRADDIEEGQARSFSLPAELGGNAIAVFHQQGEWYALDDCCSHARIPIVDGPIKNGCLMCPWHYAEFDLKTGAALSGPATEAIRSYPVRLNETGTIEVKL